MAYWIVTPYTPARGSSLSYQVVVLSLHILRWAEKECFFPGGD